MAALPNPVEKKTPEKIRYRGGRFSFFLSLEKPFPSLCPVSGSFSPLYLGNKENIVYIIIKTCIRRDDACRSTVFIHMFGLREIILFLTDRGAQMYRTDGADRHGVCPIPMSIPMPMPIRSADRITIFRACSAVWCLRRPCRTWRTDVSDRHGVCPYMRANARMEVSENTVVVAAYHC